MDFMEEFEKKIREKEIRKVQIRKEKRKEKMLNLETEVFKRSELLEKYTAKILFGWNDGKFKDKYLRKLGEIKKEKEKGDKYYYSTLELLDFILFSLI